MTDSELGDAIRLADLQLQDLLKLLSRSKPSALPLDVAEALRVNNELVELLAERHRRRKRQAVG